MNAAIFLALFAAFAWMSWVVYLAAMTLKRHRKELEGLPTLVQYVARSVVGVGAVLDVVLNVVFATVAFLDPPRELLLTSRLQRYTKRPAAAWRVRLAKKVCHSLLDLFDPDGRHC